MNKGKNIFEVPEHLYSLFSDAINSIEVENEKHYASLPNKASGYIIEISKDDCDKIKLHWQNNKAVILLFNGGQIIKQNIIINSSYKIELNTFDKTEFLK
ncbi:MAG: hypothetical protein A2068_10415 [Ignavibacteria bacterium GWB2_35_6b]|nr:MAG: hypothetical protein A2068_10415 [Ignavibacteria bacterium GWB2_35_6b]